MAILAIDIGAARITAGKVDEHGRILSSRAIKTPTSLGAFETALHYMVATAEPPEQIGIGCGSLRGTLDYLEGQRLDDLIRPALRGDVPIYADSDARAAMAAEWVWGAARGCADAVMLAPGTSAGGAVIAGGRLLRGRSGLAGRLGHITVDPAGAPCTCGNCGCLETVFSECAIETAAFDAVRRGCPSLLSEWFHGKPSEVTCQAVFEAAAGGDEPARSIAARAVCGLATGITGLLTALDPEVLIVSGRMAAAGAALFGPLRTEVHKRTRRMLGRDVAIVPRHVEDETGVVGAAALARCGNRPGRLYSQ